MCFLCKIINYYLLDAGPVLLAIDYSTAYSLVDDPRVHELYKENFPDFCQEYLLWRVRHDGSCWNSVGITLVLHALIEGGEGVFDKALERFSIIFAHSALSKSEQKLVKKFLKILIFIRKKMDHRFSLAIRNYKIIYKTLDQGFRLLLAQLELQQENPDYSYATNIIEPESLGHMSNIKPLLADLGLPYAGIDCFADNKQLVIKTDLEEYTSSGLQMPTMLAFGSSPGYADVAVKKSFALEINSSNIFCISHS